MLPLRRMSKAFYTNAHQSQIRRVIPDLFRSRQLLFDLISKDLRVRYRYAAIGFLWAVIEPLMMMIILTFVFVYVFQMRFPGLGGDSSPRETAVKILCGLLAWQFFSTALSSATSSLVDNNNLVSKVNFPREVLPLSYVGVALFNLIIGAFLLLIVFGVLLFRLPAQTSIAIPLLFGFELMLVVGLGLLLSSLNASFRDVSYIVNTGLMFGFYASPIIYEPSMVQEAFPKLYYLYFLNPMAGFITGYREMLFEGSYPDPGLLAWPCISAVLALVAGVVVFRRSAATVADKL